VNLLLYGAPGSGKGTQANMLRSHFGIPHIATGDMLRAEIQAGTELGRKAQPILAAGQYVSDGIMIDIVRSRLSRPDCAPGFIMDGFPRTVPQAEALDELMAELGKRFDRVIYLQVPVDDLLHRLSGRLVCPACQRTYPPARGRQARGRPPSDRDLPRQDGAGAGPLSGWRAGFRDRRPGDN